MSLSLASAVSSAQIATLHDRQLADLRSCLHEKDFHLKSKQSELMRIAFKADALIHAVLRAYVAEYSCVQRQPLAADLDHWMKERGISVALCLKGGFAFHLFTESGVMARDLDALITVSHLPHDPSLPMANRHFFKQVAYRALTSLLSDASSRSSIPLHPDDFLENLLLFSDNSLFLMSFAGIDFAFPIPSENGRPIAVVGSNFAHESLRVKIPLSRLRADLSLPCSLTSEHAIPLAQLRQLFQEKVILIPHPELIQHNGFERLCYAISRGWTTHEQDPVRVLLRSFASRSSDGLDFDLLIKLIQKKHLRPHDAWVLFLNAYLLSQSDLENAAYFEMHFQAAAAFEGLKTLFPLDIQQLIDAGFNLQTIYHLSVLKTYLDPSSSDFTLRRHLNCSVRLAKCHEATLFYPLPILEVEERYALLLNIFKTIPATHQVRALQFLLTQFSSMRISQLEDVNFLLVLQALKQPSFTETESRLMHRCLPDIIAKGLTALPFEAMEELITSALKNLAPPIDPIPLSRALIPLLTPSSPWLSSLSSYISHLGSGAFERAVHQLTSLPALLKQLILFWEESTLVRVPTTQSLVMFVQSELPSQTPVFQRLACELILQGAVTDIDAWAVHLKPSCFFDPALRDYLIDHHPSTLLTAYHRLIHANDPRAQAIDQAALGRLCQKLRQEELIPFLCTLVERPMMQDWIPPILRKEAVMDRIAPMALMLVKQLTQTHSVVSIDLAWTLLEMALFSPNITVNTELDHEILSLLKLLPKTSSEWEDLFVSFAALRPAAMRSARLNQTKKGQGEFQLLSSLTALLSLKAYAALPPLWLDETLAAMSKSCLDLPHLIIQAQRSKPDVLYDPMIAQLKRQKDPISCQDYLFLIRFFSTRVDGLRTLFSHMEMFRWPYGIDPLLLPLYQAETASSKLYLLKHYLDMGQTALLGALFSSWESEPLLRQFHRKESADLFLRAHQHLPVELSVPLFTSLLKLSEGQPAVVGELLGELTAFSMAHYLQILQTLPVSWVRTYRSQLQPTISSFLEQALTEPARYESFWKLLSSRFKPVFEQINLIQFKKIVSALGDHELIAAVFEAMLHHFDSEDPSQLIDLIQFYQDSRPRVARSALIGFFDKILGKLTFEQAKNLWQTQFFLGVHPIRSEIPLLLKIMKKGLQSTSPSQIAEVMSISGLTSMDDQPAFSTGLYALIEETIRSPDFDRRMNLRPLFIASLQLLPRHPRLLRLVEEVLIHEMKALKNPEELTQFYNTFFCLKTSMTTPAGRPVMPLCDFSPAFLATFTKELPKVIQRLDYLPFLLLMHSAEKTDLSFTAPLCFEIRSRAPTSIYSALCQTNGDTLEAFFAITLAQDWFHSLNQQQMEEFKLQLLTVVPPLLSLPVRSQLHVKALETTLLFLKHYYTPEQDPRLDQLTFECINFMLKPQLYSFMPEFCCSVGALRALRYLHPRQHAAIFQPKNLGSMEMWPTYLYGFAELTHPDYKEGQKEAGIELIDWITLRIEKNLPVDELLVTLTRLLPFAGLSIEERSIASTALKRLIETCIAKRTPGPAPTCLDILYLLMPHLMLLCDATDLPAIEFRLAAASSLINPASKFPELYGAFLHRSLVQMLNMAYRMIISRPQDALHSWDRLKETLFTPVMKTIHAAPLPQEARNDIVRRLGLILRSLHARAPLTIENLGIFASEPEFLKLLT